jgi:hypothetical protein
MVMGQAAKKFQGVFNAGCFDFIFFVLPGLLRSVVIVVSLCPHNHFTFGPWLDPTTEFFPVLFRDAGFRPDLQGSVETVILWHLRTRQRVGFAIENKGVKK